MRLAAKEGDIFITVTGDINVVAKDHFPLLKDGAIVANSGHFDVEIDLKNLEKMATSKREVRPLVTEYVLPKSGKTKAGKKIYILGEGRLVNLACAEGHPAEVMDLSFANQALSSEFIVKHNESMRKQVYSVPKNIDEKVAALKLKTMGAVIDKLTPEQKRYLSSWEEGT
jgi:adenosylhomocysteinase